MGTLQNQPVRIAHPTKSAGAHCAPYKLRYFKADAPYKLQVLLWAVAPSSAPNIQIKRAY